MLEWVMSPAERFFKQACILRQHFWVVHPPKERACVAGMLCQLAYH